MVLVLGCVVLLAANLAVFLRAFVFDRDTFVDAVAPRQPDEAVVDGLSDTLSIRIVEAPAVQRRIDELLPADNPLVAEVVTELADDAIASVLRDVLRSDAFRTVWRAAVERAHGAFVRVVEDRDREPVVLDLTRTLTEVDQRLEARGVDLLDEDTIADIGRVVTVRQDQIDEVRSGLDLLRRFTLPLALLAVALLAAAVALARDRRRMLLVTGVGVALTMALTAVALGIARDQIADRIEIDTRRAAVVSLWNRVVDTLVRQTVLLLVAGLALALVAWLLGPSNAAASLRRRLHFHPTATT